MKTENKIITKHATRLCLLRYMLHLSHLSDEDYRALRWFKLWSHHDSSDIAAPSAKTVHSYMPYFTGQREYTNQFEANLKLFRRIRMKLKSFLCDDLQLLEHILREQSHNNLDASSIYDHLSESQKKNLKLSVIRIAEALKSLCCESTEYSSSYRTENSDALNTFPVSVH